MKMIITIYTVGGEEDGTNQICKQNQRRIVKI